MYRWIPNKINVCPPEENKNVKVTMYLWCSSVWKMVLSTSKVKPENKFAIHIAWYWSHYIITPQSCDHFVKPLWNGCRLRWQPTYISIKIPPSYVDHVFWRSTGYTFLQTCEPNQLLPIPGKNKKLYPSYVCMAVVGGGLHDVEHWHEQKVRLTTNIQYEMRIPCTLKLYVIHLR